MSDWRIVSGDCVEAMRAMPEASVDAIVTDPPYGLGFMGKEWDGFGGAKGLRAEVRERQEATALRNEPFGRSARPAAPAPGEMHAFQAWSQTWAMEALRVLKPGGHLLAFGGTRTYHRLACAVEDAGFEIRDALIWLYGSGFPKSLDVSKAIDKAAGAEREVVGFNAAARIASGSDKRNAEQGKRGRVYNAETGCDITAPATPDAERWQGWGTALKPAHEPIVVARKPLAGTVAANVLAHGTGALNVDGCRIGTDSRPRRSGANGTYGGLGGSRAVGETTEGRWPANVVLSHLPECERVGERRVPSSSPPVPQPNFDTAQRRATGLDATARNGEVSDGYADADGMETVEAWDCAEGCPVAALDAQSGSSTSRKGRPGRSGTPGEGWGIGTAVGSEYDDTGGASRFFATFPLDDLAIERFRYTAKAGGAERNAGLDGFEQVDPATLTGRDPDAPGLSGAKANRGQTGNPRAGQSGAPRANVHPTVKPLALMRWLVRLVTPPGGTVLDPFTGSGTTGCAAALEGVAFIGCEREAEYVALAEARIAWWAEHGEDGLRELAAAQAAERRSEQRRAEAEASGQGGLF